MSWAPKKQIWPWRKYLTPEEAVVIRQSDEARTSIERLQADWKRRWAGRRALIVNRALQRAKYNERKGLP